MVPLMTFLKKFIIASGRPIFDWDRNNTLRHHVKFEELSKLIDFRFIEADRSISDKYTTLYIHAGTGELFYRMDHFTPGATYRWNFEFSEDEMKISKIHKGRKPFLLIDYQPNGR